MDHKQALPIGTKLYEFEILSVLGNGGFGMVYLAKDTNLGEDIVIKEYLPNQYAVRESDQTVKAKSIRDEEEFEWGLERFLAEAQELATFRYHPNIVNVLRYFKANNTGYMVMEYIKGVSLGSYLEKHQVLSEEQVLTLILPLLDALKTIHNTGVIHRDLKPDNILINHKGQPVLIDFGAARHAIGAKSMNITSIISHGYSPFEQYTTNAKQGPWTDIYALGVVMYCSVTGKKPTDAITRKDNDDYTSVKEKCAKKYIYSESLLKAIDWALQVNAKDRPQSINEWEKVLNGQEEILDIEKTPIIEPIQSITIKKTRKLLFIFSGIVVILMIAGGVFYANKTFFIDARYAPIDRINPKPPILQSNIMPVANVQKNSSVLPPVTNNEPPVSAPIQSTLIASEVKDTEVKLPNQNLIDKNQSLPNEARPIPQKRPRKKTKLIPKKVQKTRYNSSTFDPGIDKAVQDLIEGKR